MAEKIEWIGKVDFLFIASLIATELNKYAKAAVVYTSDEMDTLLLNKVDVEAGKGLSTEDFTTVLKNKLSDIDLSLYSTTDEMNAAIKDAVKDISGIEFDGPYDSYAEMVQMVTDPKKGTIYLVDNGGAAPDGMDEYFWTGERFEFFGSTQIDLSSYVKWTDVEELDTAELKAIWDSVFNS